MREFDAEIALEGLLQYGVLLSSRVQHRFAMILRDPSFCEQVRALGQLIQKFPEDISLECRVVDLMLLHMRVGGKTNGELILAAGTHAQTCETCRTQVSALQERSQS